MNICEIKSLSKEEKIAILLDYARNCYENGFKPTKRSVRKKFHLEIYNYFKNIRDYHEKARITVDFRFFKKNRARFMIIERVRKEVKAGHFPEFREIEKKFRIKFKTYFSNLEELYECANIDYSLAQKERNLSRFYSKKIIAKQKDLIKKFIQKNVANGIYPSVHFIQKNLKLSFYNLYDDIFQAYENAGVNYNRPSPIILGKKKEKIFTEIVKELFTRMGYVIRRVSLESEADFNRNADMTLEDKFGRQYIVELKAYRSDYHISKREVLQLQKYLQQEKISNGIFITTSNTVLKSQDNVQFFNGKAVIALLKSHNLSKSVKLVKWIQKARVNSKERKAAIEDKKSEIFDYIKCKGRIPTKREIEMVLKTDIRSVFGRRRPYEKLLNEVRIKCPLPNSQDTFAAHQKEHPF